MLKPEQIAHKIEKIIESKGMSNRKFLAEHGLKPNTIDAMKRGSMPAADKLATIAEILEVPVDYLIYRNEPIAIKAKKDDWIRILNQFSDDDLIKLKSYAEFLLSQKEGENNG